MCCCGIGKKQITSLSLSWITREPAAIFLVSELKRIAMSKAQKGNKEKKKPKADKNQPKTHVSPYKAAQDQAKPSFNPFAKKT